MAKRSPDNNTTSQAPKKRGAIGWIFTLIGWGVSLMMCLIASVIVGTLIEWGGMFLGFWGKTHAQEVLVQELSYLGNNFTVTLFGISAQDTANLIITTLQKYLVGTSQHGGQDAMWIMRQLHKLGGATSPYLNAFIYVVIVTAIRATIILLSLAMLTIIGIAAIVDGLHLRELRKVGGGVEHAGIYHRAKAAIPLTITLPLVLYLAWPTSINPNVIFLPGFALFYIAVLTAFSTFKKFV